VDPSLLYFIDPHCFGEVEFHNFTEDLPVMEVARKTNLMLGSRPV
jgi:hypothetical protein